MQSTSGLVPKRPTRLLLFWIKLFVYNPARNEIGYHIKSAMADDSQKHYLKNLPYWKRLIYAGSLCSSLSLSALLGPCYHFPLPLPLWEICMRALRFVGVLKLKSACGGNPGGAKPGGAKPGGGGMPGIP